MYKVTYTVYVDEKLVDEKLNATAIEDKIDTKQTILNIVEEIAEHIMGTTYIKPTIENEK